MSILDIYHAVRSSLDILNDAIVVGAFLILSLVPVVVLIGEARSGRLRLLR